MRPAVEQQLMVLATASQHERWAAERAERDRCILQVAFSRQALAAGMTWQWIGDRVGGVSAVAARRFYLRNEKKIGPTDLRELANRLNIDYLMLRG